NVATGRVANLFDLKGANVVVDAGPGSLIAALESARGLLTAGDCEVVLAGAMQCAPAIHRAPDGEPSPDGICLLAVTTAGRASARGLPVVAALEVQGDAKELRFVPPNGAVRNGGIGEAAHRVDSGGASG